MTELADYFRAADAVVHGSLEEGVGVVAARRPGLRDPVVATAVGGMAVQLDGYAALTPRRHPQAMAEALLNIADHPARGEGAAHGGRDYVVREWSREKAFHELQRTLDDVVTVATRAPRQTAA